MIEFKKKILDNGLTLLVNEDTSTPLLAMNILYMAGAKNEDPGKTGFAHLFEHLMFGGSVNIPVYDEPLQKAGGENNAFTNNDFTNYYLTLPAQNMETAFWLESDRMLSLAFSEKSLEVQRNVVVEEFKQRYLNQPYGDVWLHLRPLAYKVHPYRWPTIGREVSHIENATLDDVKSFFKKFYHPSNAVLSLSGNINFDKAVELTEKWFGTIPSGEKPELNIPAEPAQNGKRTLIHEADVPYDAIYKAWHCGRRTDDNFYATDLLTDILSSGKSSRLYNKLVKEKKIFSSFNLYMSGDIDPGLIVAEGKLYPGMSFESAEEAIDAELAELTRSGVTANELTKVKNKSESALVFSEMSNSTRALHLAYFEMLGNAEQVNLESTSYGKVSGEQIKKTASEVFRDENSSVLYYTSKK